MQVTSSVVCSVDIQWADLLVELDSQSLPVCLCALLYSSSHAPSFPASSLQPLLHMVVCLVICYTLSHAGARSLICNAFVGCFVLFVIGALSDAIYYVPIAALGAAISSAVVSSFQVHSRNDGFLQPGG